MISFEQVGVRFADDWVLREVDLDIDEGELCLVVGHTGSGKSTLLGAINGLVPHFTGGTLAGTVRVGGRSTRDFPPRELADVVGVVGQDPVAGFVTDTVEEELAYGMEQLAVPPEVMRKRVEETLDLLGLAGLRRRALNELSGGQQQRVAIGSVLTAHPQVLVLDEPTSALDPTAAEEVLAAITRLVHDLGMTVVLAEHRLERVVQYADRAVHVVGDGSVRVGTPQQIFAEAGAAPPVVELARLAGWSPVPLSVRDARREAVTLRSELASSTIEPARPPAAGAAPVLSAKDLSVRYGQVVAVREVSLELFTGQVCALMGRNGSGKSSLLWALQGSGGRSGGKVSVQGLDPAQLRPARRRSLVGLVPQTPSDLLYRDTVDAELHEADRTAGDTGPAARTVLDRLSPGIAGDQHPRDLSEGQRLALVLAVTLRAMPEMTPRDAPAVLLLDEPTRGLDYAAKAQLTRILDELARAGHAILVSTHDVEFVAGSADRVVVLAEGEIVTDGPAAAVLTASPSFAPQVSKILAPVPVVTVAQVARTLAAR